MTSQKAELFLGLHIASDHAVCDGFVSCGKQSDRENADKEAIQRERRTTATERSVESHNLLVKGRTISCCSSQNMGRLAVELQERCKSNSETGDGIET